MSMNRFRSFSVYFVDAFLFYFHFVCMCGVVNARSWLGFFIRLDKKCAYEIFRLLFNAIRTY